MAPRVVTYLETAPGSDELRVVHLDQHATAEQIRRAVQRRTELWDLLAAGRLNLKYIDLPLGEITRAIDLVATRSNLGRVVLRTR